MVSKIIHLHDGRRGSALSIHIVRYSDNNKIVNVLPDGTLEITLQFIEVEEDSNSALIHFLSKILSVPKEKIEVVAGQSGQDKLVSILDIDPAVVQERIYQNKK